MRMHDCSVRVSEGVSASKGRDIEGVKELSSSEEGVPTSEKCV